MSPWRRVAIWLALAGAPAAGWVAYERARGPRAEMLPAELPYLVRDPPPSAAAFPAQGNGVNPGEEVRRLHARGVTGKHVGIAIIDQLLLTGHREYANRLRWYDEIDAAPEDTARWHGTAVASIAAGQTVGVAPEADLYFVGLGMIWSREPWGDWFVAARRSVHTGMPLALSIRRILEMNRRLEADRKIRVISISIGGGAEEAIAEARNAGLFVATAALGLEPYGPVTIASPAGPDAYTTHGQPAGSWAIAHAAGRYALACQEDPAMTPERFLQRLSRAR